MFTNRDTNEPGGLLSARLLAHSTTAGGSKTSRNTRLIRRRIRRGCVRVCVQPPRTGGILAHSTHTPPRCVRGSYYHNATRQESYGPSTFPYRWPQEEKGNSCKVCDLPAVRYPFSSVPSQYEAMPVYIPFPINAAPMVVPGSQQLNHTYGL